MQSALQEIIIAQATPPGVSAIAILRCSGSGCFDISQRLAGPSITARGIYYARLRDSTGDLLDEVMLLAMPGPQSPTGEDVLEIHCHGSVAVIDALLREILSWERVRLAQAGEFTRRAFHNGKLDLTQTEGLGDLLAAQTQAQRLQALRQLGGGLSDQALKWRRDIIALLGHLEASIDFADEALPASLVAQINEKAAQLIGQMGGSLADGVVGARIRHGVQVVLIGPVNAGKSTAINALAKRDVAIVSNEEGTTRDAIEVQLNLAGLPVTLTDTAGLRETQSQVEKKGISLARDKAAEADACVILLDASAPDWQEMLHKLRDWSDRPCLIVLNKADKVSMTKPDEVDLLVSLSSDREDASDHISLLEDALAGLVKPLNNPVSPPLITQARHHQEITRAKKALEAGLMVDIDTAPELRAEDWRQAADALGRLVGQIDVEDLLDHIFGQFCIGK